MAGPYYVDVTTGDDGDTGLSEELAFATLSHAADTIAAGETCYVKASASYVVEDGANDCVMYITTAGAAASTINWIGYKTTIADGGIVKIDAGTNVLAHAVKTAIGGAVWNAFVNFDCQGATGNGFDSNSGSDDSMTFKNCRFYNNGGKGILVDNTCLFVNCIASDNTGIGFDGDSFLVFIACVSHTNSAGFLVNNSTVIYNSLAYNNSANDFHSGGVPTSFLGCTSDCEGDVGDNCFVPYGWHDAVVNCVAHDGDTGIYATAYGAHMCISRHNVFNSSNTADVRADKWLPTSEGGGIGNRGDVVDPANMFLDEASDDYTPHATGGMVGVGIDSYFCQQFWADYNNGAGDNPPAE